MQKSLISRLTGRDMTLADLKLANLKHALRSPVVWVAVASLPASLYASCNQSSKVTWVLISVTAAFTLAALLSGRPGRVLGAIFALGWLVVTLMAIAKWGLYIPG